MPARSCSAAPASRNGLTRRGGCAAPPSGCRSSNGLSASPEHHPGHVGWDEYLATRERLRSNVISAGEGGGAAREGVGLLQGIVRCGQCGRRTQVAYSGKDGRVPRYACVRAHHLHGTDHAWQSVGGQRLEKAIAAAFLDAVTPAGIRASAQAIEEIERHHDERLAGQRLAVERAEFEAGRARRQFDACEPPDPSGRWDPVTSPWCRPAWPQGWRNAGEGSSTVLELDLQGQGCLPRHRSVRKTG